MKNINLLSELLTQTESKQKSLKKKSFFDFLIPKPKDKKFDNLINQLK